jgi:hypothetical protein
MPKQYASDDTAQHVSMQAMIQLSMSPHHRIIKPIVVGINA